MGEQNSATQAAAGNDLPVTTPEEDRYGFVALAESHGAAVDKRFVIGGPVGDSELLLSHGTACVVRGCGI